MSHLAASNAGGAAGSQSGSGGAAAAAASQDHAASDSAPAASASSSSSSAAAAAAASSSGSPHLFDLSGKTRGSVSISEADWVRSYTSSLVKMLLGLSGRSAVLALIVYFQASSNASLAFLNDLSLSDLKKVCHLIAVVPVKLRKEECVVAITKSIQSHMEQYPHLVDVGAASKSSAAARSTSDHMDLGYDSPPANRVAHAHASSSSSSSSSSSGSEHEELPRAKSGRAAAAAAAPPSPARRSGRQVPPSPARASKTLFASSSSLKPSSSQLSKAQASVLAALASIPGAPSDDDATSAARSKSDRRRVSMARESTDGRKSKKGKNAKRDKKHEKKSGGSKGKSRRKLLSDEDSDSDGPAGRGHSSSDESSDSSSSASSSSSSSSASSSSDSDDPSSRRHRKRKHASSMESNGLTKSLAKPWIRNALASMEGRGTILDIHKDKVYKTERNKRECETLSKIIDCLRKQKHPPRNVKRALEFAVRRLVGVQTADMSGSWAVCDQFELVMDKQSFVPDEFLARALKNAARLESLEHSARPGRRGGGAGAAAAASSSNHNKSGAGAGKQNKSRGRGPPRDGSTDSRGPGSNSTKSDKDAKGPRK